MNEHLTEAQLDAALLAEEDAAVVAHRAVCENCRNELQQLRALLAGVRVESIAFAERPQNFWRAQRLAIAAQISAGLEMPTQPLAWAASLAVIVLAAAFLSHGLPGLQPQLSRTTPPAAVESAADADHDLLVDIERSVRRDVPRALEPASLIAQELHRAASKSNQ